MDQRGVAVDLSTPRPYQRWVSVLITGLATLGREGGGAMIRTVEAIIDEKGQVRLLEPIRSSSPHRALVTILDEQPVAETALLGEMTLSADWDRPEEDAAWAHLQGTR